eukprot:gene7874-10689_t
MKFHLMLLLIPFMILINISYGVKRKKKVDNKNDGPVEEITFNSKSELNSQINELKNRQREDLNEPISAAKLKEFKEEESFLQKRLMKSVLDHGEDSREKATALHALGGNLYKQGRYEEVLSFAKEIVRIHEMLDGVEHVNTAHALGNLGSVAFRIGNEEECELAMNRALFIMIKVYGAESKEVLMQRGKMLTFRIKHAETTSGLSHEDYLYEL